MSTGADALQFVISSSVRSDVLRTVADGTTTTDGLLAAVEASSSAVYDALGRLEDAGLLHSAGDDWSLTGSGRIVADCVCSRERLASLLADAGDYLSTHDTCAVPEPFRHRFGELAGGEVIEASATQPQAVVREVSDRLDSAEEALIVTPIYDELFESVLPEEEGTRVVVDPSVVDSEAAAVDSADIPALMTAYDGYDVRVAEVNFALGVTESALLLSLPLCEGGYDPQTEFVAEHEAARAWGRELFDACWSGAQPLQAYVRETHL